MTTLYSAMEGPTRYKVVVVGAPQVGKTSLVRTWAREPLPYYYIPTMGVSVHPVQMGMEAELVIHDVGGTTSPRSIEKVLFEADAVVLVYDCSRVDKTLGVLDKDWIPAANILAKAKALFLLVACNVPIDPAIKCMISPPEKVQTWWKQVTTKGNKAVMFFSSVINIRDHAEMSRHHLYDFIRTSLGEQHSSS